MGYAADKVLVVEPYFLRHGSNECDSLQASTTLLVSVI